MVLPKTPEKNPELKHEIVISDGRHETGRKRIEDHPEISELFTWYVEYQWKPWATAERPRRQTIARYNKLFSLQQAISSEGAETPLELVWGIGYSVWKKQGFGTAVSYPLLIQACEVSLNEKTFDLEVRPRDIEARLDADCYAEMGISGVKQLEAYWRGALASGANRVNPFEPSTFEGTLKAAVGHLDPSGSYENCTGTNALPVSGDSLKITNTWVLFGRRRSGDIFLEDIRRLKKNVEEAQSLPNVIRSFVEPGDSEVRVRPEQAFRGLSTSDGSNSALELYFPMPYNDEQVAIVQKLHTNDGVVVQGPPGTGKTHTIANVICHYLAQGKRVLVTAKSESALAVLQEKLPKRIRPLSVALLSDERDGMKQFEHSIQTIASQVAAINPTRAVASISAAEEKLNQLHAKISHVDREVAAYAGKHMRSYTFQGNEVSPEEMAKLVIGQAEEHQWFDDEPSISSIRDASFNDEDINALRQSRMRVADDISYVGSSPPSTDALPSWPDLLSLHRDLQRAKSIDASVSQGQFLSLVDSRLETFDRAQALVTFFDERAVVKTRLSNAQRPWLEVVIQRLADMQPTDSILKGLLDTCANIRRLEEQRRELVAKAVEVPTEAELNEHFVEAVGRLVAGKSAFGLPFGKSDARKLISSVTVTGTPPCSTADWEFVHEVLAWRREARKVQAQWASLSAEFGFSTGEGTLETAFRSVAKWQADIESARQLVFEFNANLHGRLVEVFGKVTADRVWNEGEQFIVLALASLHAHVDKGRLAYAMKRVQELMKKLDGHTGEVVRGVRQFFTDSLGATSIDDAALQGMWTTLYAELGRVCTLCPDLEQMYRIAGAIEAAGALKWANRVRSDRASRDHDAVVPIKWQEAWHWRQAVMFLDGIDAHHKIRSLLDERKTLTTALSRTYQELVADKTWLGVFNNSPDFVRQALQTYLNAIHAMGAGTGVRAVRHRKAARDAMTRAYRAVPCWVLPQWRVSETIPSEVGLFDLVIIDEASQSDIWALPALLRGKKILVVGDHKQVSPSAVGMAEVKVQELVNRFLVSQAHGTEMTPDKSIYDLARVVFAGNSVMLKEHFRCVPAIIEFSNREFYENDIQPLRVPKANERLDPPLIDVFVSGGFRDGNENPAEAKAIVDEIESILAE